MPSRPAAAVPAQCGLAQLAKGHLGVCFGRRIQGRHEPCSPAAAARCREADLFYVPALTYFYSGGWCNGSMQRRSLPRACPSSACKLAQSWQPPGWTARLCWLLTLRAPPAAAAFSGNLGPWNGQDHMRVVANYVRTHFPFWWVASPRPCAIRRSLLGLARPPRLKPPSPLASGSGAR